MLSVEREKEIREAITKEVWGTNSFGLDVIKELLAELDRVRAELKPLRECYGPAGMKAVSKFIEERDQLREIADKYVVYSACDYCSGASDVFRDCQQHTACLDLRKIRGDK